MPFNLYQQPSSSDSLGLSRLSVSVVGVDGSTVTVRDPIGTLSEINGGRRPKGVGLPDVGEQWIIEKSSEGWEFRSMVEAPPPVVVTGATAEAAIWGLVDALSAAGLIVDKTTRPAPVVLNATTDPSVQDSAAVPLEDLGYEGEPIGATAASAPVEGSASNDYPYRVSADVPGLAMIASVQFPPDLGPKRLRADVERLLSQSDMIVMRGVTRSEKVAALSAAKPASWTEYRSTTATHKGQVIWFDAAVFGLVGAPSQSTLVAAGASGYPLRPAAVAKFVHLATKVEFSVVTAQLENGAAYRGTYAPARTPTAPTHISRMKTALTSLASTVSGVRGPVVLFGGFNISQIDDDRERDASMLRAKMSEVRLKSVWEDVRPAHGTRRSEEAVLDGAFWGSPVDGQFSVEQPRVLLGYYSEGRPVSVRCRFSNFR